MPKKRLLATNKRIQAEGNQVRDFYLGLNEAGREFVMHFLAAANIPAYTKQPGDIDESQTHKPETRPEIQEVEGIRSYASQSTEEYVERRLVVGRRWTDHAQRRRRAKADLVALYNDKAVFFEVKSS